MRMSAMLLECLRERGAELGASLRGPASHGPDVIVQSVMLLQPAALAVVAGQCFRLLLELDRYIHETGHRRRISQRVNSRDRIGVVEVGYAGRWPSLGRI